GRDLRRALPEPAVAHTARYADAAADCESRAWGYASARLGVLCTVYPVWAGCRPFAAGWANLRPDGKCPAYSIEHEVRQFLRFGGLDDGLCHYRADSR